MSDETRKNPRIPVHLEVRYRTGSDLAKSFVESLSQGGVFIRTSRPLTIGTEVTLEIRVEGEAESVRVKGKVVWEKMMGQDGGMGISFTEQVPDQLRKLLTSRGA